MITCRPTKHSPHEPSPVILYQSSRGLRRARFCSACRPRWRPWTGTSGPCRPGRSRSGRATLNERNLKWRTKGQGSRGKTFFGVNEQWWALYLPSITGYSSFTSISYEKPFQLSKREWRLNVNFARLFHLHTIRNTSLIHCKIFRLQQPNLVLHLTQMELRQCFLPVSNNCVKHRTRSFENKATKSIKIGQQEKVRLGLWKKFESCWFFYFPKQSWRFSEEMTPHRRQSLDKSLNISEKLQARNKNATERAQLICDIIWQYNKKVTIPLVLS